MKLQAALLIATCFVSLSCVNRPADFNPTEGEALDYALFDQTLSEAFGQESLAGINTKSFHSSIKTVQIADYPERVGSQIGQSVLCFKMDTGQYNVVQQVITYGNNNEQNKSTTEYNYPPITDAMMTSFHNFHLLLLICDPKIKFNIDSNAVCSNLEVKRFTSPPPLSVQQKENCGGIPNCEINKVKVSFYRTFDDEDLDGNAIRNKMLYDVTISSDVPYLSKIMEMCQQGIVEIDKKTKIYARICDRTVDFEKGTTEPFLCSNSRPVTEQ